MQVFVFDIETVPDTASAQRLLGLEGLDPRAVVEAMAGLRRAETGGSEFPRLYLHRIVVISIAMRQGDRFRVWSIGDEGDDEATIVQRFFDGIERYSPNLVSWNGSGFDLPVLHYRAMLHGVRAPRYWETGETESTFRWNNYLNRFHERHLDLMDVLAGHQPRAAAPLDQLASLCGFPGKMGMSGAAVADAVAAGRFAEVRDYCETDVLNTYLLYLRFQLLRGHLEPAGYAAECALVRRVLAESGAAHLQAFLDAWPPGPLEQAGQSAADGD